MRRLPFTPAAVAAAILGTGGTGLAVVLAERVDMPWVNVGGRTGGESVVPPSEEQARAALAERVAVLAAHRSSAAYCAGFVGFCEQDWQDAGGDAAAPRTPPHILGTWTSREVRNLIVCGRDGEGKPYRTDFPVRFEDGRVTPLFVLFWDNRSFHGWRPEGPVIITVPPSPTMGALPSNPPECG